MSSFLGHALAGLTAGLCCHARARLPPRWALAPFLILAICPDLDYLGIWLLGDGAHPRVTHSLLFALLAAVLMQRLAAVTGRALPLHWLLLASVSHPLMDLLVGAHPVPLWWPMQAQASAPGVLPSAGALSPGNFYLWRNLLIEMAVLLPVFAVAVLAARRVAWRAWRRWAICVAPLWAGALAWSIQLAR
ncbi:metal-dependent hydrolase [Stenotrophomonas sp.]|uniref:metal-dependent hydrolase n=1 Tax=Stenotrophomonas sp. TaxID=69392 RepID=UPI002FC7666A